MKDKGKKYYTIPEYESLQVSEPEVRYEYFDGNVFDMAGGTYEHNLITSNALFNLRLALGKGSPCKVLSSDMKVEVKAYNAYVYPDIFVFCGHHTNSGKVKDAIGNPKVIIEVLSDSTESKDRNSKFMYYRSLPSFEEYIMVNQKSATVETFYRESNTKWDIRTIQGLSEHVAIRSLNVSLAMGDIYEGIVFK